MAPCGLHHHRLAIAGGTVRPLNVNQLTEGSGNFSAQNPNPPNNAEFETACAARKAVAGRARCDELRLFRVGLPGRQITRPPSVGRRKFHCSSPI